MASAETSGVWGDAGEIFHLIYRGSTEIDRHYSKPMLPWIISEIKNQQKSVEVTVEINRGNVTLRDTSSGVVLLNHTVKQIHKCVMEQADHKFFLYTLRAPDKKECAVPGASGYMPASDPSVLIPANFTADQNYQCVLLQATSEEQVHSYFACLRQQPREAQQLNENSSFSSFNSIPDLSIHNESQFFEVLFVGRVKVSHPKVPPGFIDEATFKLREKTRQRHTSGGEGNRALPSSAAIAFQQEGNSISVPNFTFSSQQMDSDSNYRSRSNSRDLGKVNIQDIVKSEQENQDAHKFSSRVRFSLWTEDSLTESALKSYLSSSPADLRSSFEEETDSKPSDDNSKEKDEKSSQDGKANSAEDEFPVIEPMRRERLRTISGDTGHMGRRFTIPNTRIWNEGSCRINRKYDGRGRGIRYDCDLRMLGQDFNRTMLFHIGRNEVQLINPEMKSVQLNKYFKDIAQCCRGVKHDDHFGLICRELSGDLPCYLGYIFKCQVSSVTEEIMQSLSKAFAALHEAQVKERQSNLLCDHCPMRWFSQLCAEVEGLPASKAHMNIMKQLSTLPEDDRRMLIAKYEGAETSDVQTQNNILMMLLRAHFECKQASHSHTALPGGGVKPDFQIGTNLESSLRRAKKSLTTSFNQLLKREGRDHDSAEKDVAPVEEQSSTTQSNTASDRPHINPMPSHSKVHLEGLSDSPLGHRPRSSTVSSSDGDSMRREFLAKRAASKKKMSEQKPSHPNQNSPLSSKRNIFMKVGSPASRTSTEDEISEGKVNKSTSFRHAILQRVVSPNKQSDTLEKPAQKRTAAQLKIIWKKAVFQHILLIRMEKENQRLRALQQEVALQRVCLSYDEEEVPYEAMQAWNLMLSKPQARIDSNIIHSGVKQGVPKAVRGEVWQLLTLQHNLRNPRSQPTVLSYNTPYEEMLKELTSQHHAILIDLGRTFPTHPYFMQTLGPGQLALFNVLKAYSLLDQDVGYCQGLGFVGGVLLLHVEEELAYNLLKHLMFVMGCRRQYRPDPIGLQVQMYQLSRLLHEHLRNLYDHLENHEVTPQLFAAPWFLTLFASQFPMSFVCRVFDLLFMEGMEAVFRVALVLLRTHEEALLACDSFEQIMDYMKTSMPNIHLEQQGHIISQACECSLSRELHAYEVEYHVLQEELALSPQNTADVQKLKEANRNLKRQNLDLLEQLHQSNSHQHALETSNQSLQQSQHHLEVRVRWLELERNNLKQLVALLTKNFSQEELAAIPPNYQRFLPTISERQERKESSTLNKNPVEKDEKDEVQEGEVISSSLPSQDTFLQQNSGPRAVSMDHGLMQRYIKNLGHD
ncbi:TBC1 domain family member 1-like isoform X1 [Macrobrachium nipponense]|uniref:TBC1 domain family member 1-like isoform X1 n=1 Tax=Macrobrachium nipponense TaxID=159736 RepID=UPI0030C85AA3